MTAKEKAIELYNKYDNLIRDFTKGISIKDCSKQCALIAVDEILNNSTSYNAYDGVVNNELWADDEYWLEVKQEIEKL